MYILFDHDIREIECSNLRCYVYDQCIVDLDHKNYELCKKIIANCPFPYPLKFRIDISHRIPLLARCCVEGFKPYNGLVFTLLNNNLEV